MAISNCSLVNRSFHNYGVMSSDDDRKKPTTHHITPQCQDGGDSDDNTVKWPKWFHQVWHDLFQGLTPSQQLEFIQTLNMLSREREEMDGGDIHQLRQQIKNGKMPFITQAAE